jgi:hypothetical protein
VEIPAVKTGIAVPFGIGGLANHQWTIQELLTAI